LLIAVTATSQHHQDVAPQGHRDATPKVCLDMVPCLLHGVLPSLSLLVDDPLILGWYLEVQIHLGFGLVRSFQTKSLLFPQPNSSLAVAVICLLGEAFGLLNMQFASFLLYFGLAGIQSAQICSVKAILPVGA